MPWNWQGNGQKSTELGGTRGTSEEAARSRAWPEYEAEYLKERLRNGAGKYGDGPRGRAPDEIAEFVYFDKVSSDYKQEADASLKREFNLWLEGAHEDNANPAVYDNAEGKPQRLHVYRTPNNAPGDIKQGWRPTWWGRKQLTHLPGVREYLRDQKAHATQHALNMNLLAEHGPQDIESAWMYFKHWVKGRPVAAPYLNDNGHPPGTRSDIRTKPPGDMNAIPVEVQEDADNDIFEDLQEELNAAMQQPPPPQQQPPPPQPQPPPPPQPPPSELGKRSRDEWGDERPVKYKAIKADVPPPPLSELGKRSRGEWGDERPVKYTAIAADVPEDQLSSLEEELNTYFEQNGLPNPPEDGDWSDDENTDDGPISAERQEEIRMRLADEIERRQR